MRKWVISPKGIMAEVIVFLLVLGLYGAGKSTEVVSTKTTKEKDYIKWVEFDVTAEAMKRAYDYDVESYGKEMHLDWIDLLAYLGAKYGGDFSQYREADMDAFAEKIQKEQKTAAELAGDMKYFPYYKEAYGAVLGGMVGEYKMETPEKSGRNTMALKHLARLRKDSRIRIMMISGCREAMGIGETIWDTI